MERFLPLFILPLLIACTGLKSTESEINAGWQFSASDGRNAVVDLPHDAMLGAPRMANGLAGPVRLLHD